MHKHVTEKLKRRRFLQLTAAGAGAVALSGTAAGATQEGPLGQEPQWSDATFRLASFLDPNTIDPHKTADNPMMLNVVNMYDPLVTFSGDGELTPHIAEDWTVSDDGTRFEFTIREGVPFHSGNQIDAQAVAFSMERALEIDQAPVSPYAGVFDSVEVVDDRTVAFVLSRSFGPFVGTLGRFFIVDPALVEENATDEDPQAEDFLAENDAGSGPYRLVARNPGQDIRYEAFEDYWEGWPSGNAFQTARYEIIPEASTIRRLLEEGQSHKSDEWLSTNIYDQLETNENLTVHNDPDIAPLHVNFNTQNEFLSDVNVRRALSYAMDYQTVASQIAGGGASPLVGPVSDNMPFHNPDVTQYTLDLEQAQAELEQSAFDPGEIELEFVWTSGIDELRRIGLLLQSNLAQIGVDGFTINEVIWPNIVEAESSQDTAFDMISVFWTAAYPDPHDLLFNLYYSELWKDGSPTFEQAHFYDNPEVDELLVQARDNVDETVRAEAYGRVQEIVTDEAVGLFLYNKIHRVAINSDVAGYEFVPPSQTSLRSKRWNYHSM